MNLILISKTYDPILHGPARFAQAFYRQVQNIAGCTIDIVSEEIDHDPSQGLYQVNIKYPSYLPGLSEVWRNFQYYNKIHKISSRPTILIFNHSIHSIYSKLKYGKQVICIGLINDNENIRTRIFNFRFIRTWFYRYQARFLESLASKHCDLIVVCSYALKKLVAVNYRISPDKIYVLYQGVDFNQFVFLLRKSVLSQQKRIRILFIKCDYLRGGLLILRDALSKLSDLDFDLTIAGPRNSQKESIIQELTPTGNCKTIFLGPISQDRVIKLMHQNDIFCVPSLREGLGVANIEALSCGLPVVSSDSLGIPEVLNQGELGWMAKAGDAVDLARQLKLCMSQDELRRSKSEKGRAFVVQHFDIQKNIRVFLRHLEQN